MRKSVIIAGLFVASYIWFVNKPAVKAQEANNPVAQEQTTQPEPVVVEVQKGDNLSKIAKKYETTYSRLYDANIQINDPDVIHPGDKIRIPTANEQLVSRKQPTNSNVVTTTNRVNTSGRKTTPKNTKARKRQVTKQTTQASPVTTGSVWDNLARCESGGNWSINTGNGYYGGLQFTASTWRAVGGTGLPHQNSREEQIHRAQILQARSGWGQWPACTKKLGLR